MTPLPSHLLGLLKTAIALSLTLFRLMIPIIIVIKILEQFGLITLISQALLPVMDWVGLPGAMGLVWASTLVTNLYGGLVVYAALAADNPLTVAQVTVLSFMMLIAHSLPVEAGVAKKAGVSLVFTLSFRVGMAILSGILLNSIYLAFNWLQQPAVLLWTSESKDPGLRQWCYDQLLSLGFIFIIVLLLVTLLDTLDRLGVINWFNKLLRPVLHLLGIGREAETITLVGLTLGLSYGGTILIHEAQAGHIKPLDVLYSISLLGLSHSLIEDTLLLILTGAQLWSLLLVRIMLSLLVISFLIKFVSRFKLERYLVKTVA